MFLVTNILENYGWYILIGVIAFAYIYGKFLQPIIHDIRRKQEDAEYSAKYHKSELFWWDCNLFKIYIFLDPDLLLSRLEAQEKRTKLLQEKYERDAEEQKNKIEEVSAEFLTPVEYANCNYTRLSGIQC